MSGGVSWAVNKALSDAVEAWRAVTVCGGRLCLISVVAQLLSVAAGAADVWPLSWAVDIGVGVLATAAMALVAYGGIEGRLVTLREMGVALAGRALTVLLAAVAVLGWLVAAALPGVTLIGVAIAARVPIVEVSMVVIVACVAAVAARLWIAPLVALVEGEGLGAASRAWRLSRGSHVALMLTGGVVMAAALAVGALAMAMPTGGTVFSVAAGAAVFAAAAALQAAAYRRLVATEAG